MVLTKKRNSKVKKNSNRDNARYKIILWLHSRGEAIQNSMFRDSQAGLASMKWVDLTNRLDELAEWGIIQKKQSEVVSNYVYSLTDKGREIAASLVNLKEKHPELKNFDIF